MGLNPCDSIAVKVQHSLSRNDLKTKKFFFFFFANRFWFNNDSQIVTIVTGVFICVLHTGCMDTCTQKNNINLTS